MNQQKILYNKDGIIFKFLTYNDYDKGLSQVLSQLTTTEKFERTSFVKHIQEMENSRNDYINIVGFFNGRIIAFGTVILSDTLTGKRGKIENIVVCKSVRGKGLGRVVIDVLKEQAAVKGVYTISLCCQTKNVEFYKKLGFNLKGIIMQKYS